METPILLTNKLFKNENISIYFLILHFVGLASKLSNVYPNYLSGLFLDTFYYDGKDYWNKSITISDETAQKILKVTCTINKSMRSFMDELKIKYDTNIKYIKDNCNVDLIKWNGDSIEYDAHIFFTVKYFEIDELVNLNQFIKDQTLYIDNFCFYRCFIYQNNYKESKTISYKYLGEQTLESILKKNYKKIFKKLSMIDLINDLNNETKSGIDFIRDYTTHSKTLNMNLQKLYLTKNEEFNYPIKNDSFDDVFNIPYITRDYEPKKIVSPSYLYQGKNTREIELELNRYIQKIKTSADPYIQSDNFYCYRYVKFLDPTKSSITTIPEIIDMINNKPFIKFPYFLSTYSFLAKYISDWENSQFYSEERTKIYPTTQVSLEDDESGREDYEYYEDKNIPFVSSTNWIYNPYNVIMRINVNPKFANFILLDPCIKKKTCYFGNEHELLFESGCVIKLLSIEKLSFNIYLPEHYKYFVNCEMLPNEDLTVCTINKLYQMIPHDKYYEEFKLLDKNDSDYINKLYKIYENIFTQTVKTLSMEMELDGFFRQADNLIDFVQNYKTYLEISKPVFKYRPKSNKYLVTQNEPQTNHNPETIYKKYLKYKDKYLNLKSQLNKM